MTYIGVQQARALGRPPNAGTLRWPIREAVSTAQRVGALRPDGADEHQVLDSVLVFDLLTNLVELDRSERSDGPSELSPDFAVFGLEPHRPYVARILREAELREALLPGRSAEEAARLLASVDGQGHRVANAFGGFWDGIADRETAARHGLAR
jgi:hypothetical protein